MKRALGWSVLVASHLALAQPRPARDTADVGDQGSWSVGVFNPLRLAVADRFELEANPLVFFVAPHLNARYALLDGRRGLPAGCPVEPCPDVVPPPAPLRLTGEVGLSLPTFGMRLLKGWTFPSWATSGDNVGWMLIPRLGLLLSGSVGALDARARRTADVWTARAEVAVRLPLGPNHATPMDSFLAPLDLLLAAPLTGALGRVGGAYDHAFGERLRLRAELNVYLSGGRGTLTVAGANVGPLAPLSPLYLTAHLGLDIAVFKQSRITLGALWANYDQGQTVPVTGRDGFSTRVPVRSNNFLPTVDFIWAGGGGPPEG